MLRFDNKVAVVTGAGGGLGKTYALLLASRGAKVVVNDLGSSMSGEGVSTNFADKVVEQIKVKGGIAVADHHSVQEGQKIINTAIETFGRIDILINNAGIVRDISFQKMSRKDWDLVMNVHLNGAFACTRAAWNHMRKQNYGRIINTASSTGLYGMFGMANYGTAKIALHGFTQTLAKEGDSKNIKVNSIAPYAASRMMEKVAPQDLLDMISPELVAPFVCYLCHDSCNESGSLYELGGGLITKVRWQRSEGVFLDKKEMSIEEVSRRMQDINSFQKNYEYPTRADEIFERIMNLRESMKPKL